MMKARGIIFVAVLLVSLSACTEKGLDYRKEEGTIIVTPDWSGYECPSVAHYRVYTEAGTEVPSVIPAEDLSAERFTTALPVGNYHLLGFNADAFGVEFVGLEDMKAAEVCLASTKEPANVYSWCTENIEVRLGDTLEFVPHPHSLVKRMIFHFRVTGMEKVEVLYGELNGVYPSLLLMTGEPSASSLAAAPKTKTSFSATLTRAADRSGEDAYIASAELQLFGLLSPQNGGCYDCRLQMQVHNAAGEVYDTMLDMNKVVTEVIDRYEGELPMEEPIEVNIGINWVNSMLIAVVKSWTEGSGAGEV